MSFVADVVVRRPALTVRARVEASPNETVVVVGPNGAGKSTLLHAIAGLVSIEGGAIRLGDRVLADADAGVETLPAERRVGMVFQDGSLFPHMTVEDNVAFGPRSRRMPKAEARARARRELERVGLEGVASVRPASLSGGQRQRCALARALATDPELLLLDEPYGSLDVSARTEVRRTVGAAIRRSGVPAIVVTHDPIEAMALGDRMVVMESGSVAQSGTPDEIRSRPRSRYVGDLVGLNILRGHVRGSTLVVGDMSLTLADVMDGEVLATFHPHAVALYPERPEGSMRNVWQARLLHVEPYGDRVRLELDRPGGVAVEVTRAAAGQMGLSPGAAVWASLKATEIEAFPA